jgi:DNA replication factor GINS
MPEKSRLNLENILKVEREERKKLVPLEEDFYGKVAGQIQDLEDEKRKIDDTYSTKHAIIEDEQKTVKNAIESIIYKRTTKIINEARYNAEMSLHETSKLKEKQNLDSMTREERMFYNRLLDVMTEWRREVINNIFKREKPVRHQPAVIPEKDNILEIVPEKSDISKGIPDKNDIIKRLPDKNDMSKGLLEKNDINKGLMEKKEELSKEHIDKKDISKEYIVVRLLKDIPTFVGVDGRNYTLAKEDVAVLSTVNAKALINRKAAIQIMVKR